MSCRAIHAGFFQRQKSFFEMTCQFTSRLLQHSGQYLCKSDIYYSHRVKSWQRYILVAQLSNESLACAVIHDWARLSLFTGGLSRDFVTSFITSQCFCTLSWHWVWLSMDCIFLCEFITKLSEIVQNWDQSCHKGTIVGNESRSCSSLLNVCSIYSQRLVMLPIAQLGSTMSTFFSVHLILHLLRYWKVIDWSRLTAAIIMFLNLLSEKRGDSQQSFFSPYHP